MTDDIITRARDFALRHHGAQTYGPGLPYATHLRDVEAVIAASYRGGGLVLIALRAVAWLHDVIEDTHVTCADLIVEFNPALADIVWSVTGVGNNRRERNASIYAKLRAAGGPLEVSLKVADRIANLEACYRYDQPKLVEMYLRERDEFRANVVMRCITIPHELHDRLADAYLLLEER